MAVNPDKVICDYAELAAVADAVREKTGNTDKLKLDEVATAVSGFENEDLLAKRVMGTIEEYSSDEISSVNDHAFAYCNKLSDVNLPSATIINDYAFYYCTNLKNVYLPSLTDIRAYAFSYCTSLTTLELPALEYAYIYMIRKSGVRTLKIPNVKTIDDYSFYYAESLIAVVIEQTDIICTLKNKSAFSNTPIASGTGHIYVPDTLVEDYKAATNWSTYADQIKPLSEYAEVTQ